MPYRRNLIPSSLRVRILIDHLSLGPHRPYVTSLYPVHDTACQGSRFLLSVADSPSIYTHP
jgi:hypothetical protein